MGGRGSGATRNSSTSNKPVDEFGGRLGTREAVNVESKMATILEGQSSPYNRNLKKSLVNPEYNALIKNAYARNCALCTTATALQLMGYDVEAMPRAEKWRGVNNVFNIDYTTPANYIMA